MNVPAGYSTYSSYSNYLSSNNRTSSNTTTPIKQADNTAVNTNTNFLLASLKKDVDAGMPIEEIANFYSELPIDV